VTRQPAALLWWLATGTVACGIGLLCACIYPSLCGRAGRAILGYFGDVLSYSTREELRSALLRPDAMLLIRLSDQLFVVSRIVLRKYQLIQFAFWALAAGSVLVGASLIVDHLPPP
jgi:hypothetical protein